MAPAIEVIPGGSKIAMLVRRAVFDRIGAFDENYPMTSFLDWLGRARKAGLRSAMVEDVVALRRLHPANSGRTDKQSHDDERLLALKRLIDARR